MIDYSIAGATGLFNNRTFQWDNLALEMIGLFYFGFKESIPFIISVSDGGLVNLGTRAVNK